MTIRHRWSLRTRTPPPTGATASTRAESRPPGPPCLALTGGIGSGKSAALDAFARRGAAVLSADEVVHALYRDPAIIRRVRERFGPDVLTVGGEVDRRALSGHAFAADDGMAFLEGLLHPRIARARREWIARVAASDPPPPLMVCEVPMLFEAGLADAFDAVVVVTAPEGVRRARVAGRGQDFDLRSRRQQDEDAKVAAADMAFVNDGSPDALDQWVGSVMARYAVADGTP